VCTEYGQGWQGEFLDLDGLTAIPGKKGKKLKAEDGTLSPGGLQSPRDDAKVHALVTNLSPIKPSWYFEGQLTDEESVVRLVGFNKKQRERVWSNFAMEIFL
jgi:hypothetical protein